MELYLDSADFNEIEKAFKLGFLDGLTTTPTFMHRHGVTDVDSLILKLADIVPVLQVEALGKTAEEIYAEAHRQINMGLDPKKSVFKIPISLEGVKACRMLRNEDIMVNVHLVYTLQQAYMAMHAGANYVCPLVGRLQDQGHDALSLVEQCVDAVNYYGYDTKIMFSSVRNIEHVRNAINIGVHNITVPYKILTQMSENNFTKLGTEQFYEHTRLMTVKVNEVMSSINPVVSADTDIQEAIVKMTEYGFGCIIVTNGNDEALGVFTDGDLRRLLQSSGRDSLKMKLGDLKFNKPVSIDADELLFKANETFKEFKVDNLLVTANAKPVGLLDIQDL
ncbi:MAG: CBS domain-containing protein [Bacteroidales bacterium]|nr:CBS domain-containing protein [Bacteroidales bacterium]MBN2756996.1 CBS domain-containing protein [Bacteroidales bacterium]